MTSTFGSIFLGESQSISKPPYFCGANYSYWKTRMMLFVQANDLAVWDIIMDGPSIPFSKKEWNMEDERSIQHNAKAMHALSYALGLKEYSREVNNLETLSLDELIGSLLTHEMRFKRRNKEEEKFETKAGISLKSTIVEGDSRKEPIICYECKKPGHIKFDFPQWKKKKKGSSKLKLKAHVATWSDEDSSDNDD
ncbi:hypothetical protein V6Z12_A05G385800 [Gossypium hirsutum]